MASGIMARHVPTPHCANPTLKIPHTNIVSSSLTKNSKLPSCIHQEKVQFILCPFVTWLFPPFSAFFCIYLFLLLFLSLILKKVEKGLENVAKAEKAMPPYPFASFFSVLK